MTQIVPPVAKKHEYFGNQTLDEYHWLKDQTPDTKRPEIIDYLNAENEYAKRVHLNPAQSLTDTIYSEIISRIQEDDNSVPVRRSPYLYYNRTVKNAQYPIYARKSETLEAEEEILLNQNEMEYEYMDLGKFAVSPNHKILAYALDTDGSENYTISFKNLETGTFLLSDTIPKAAENIVWTNDSNSIYYTTMDAIHRSDKVYRHVLGTDSASDRLLFHETDEKFAVGIYKSLSEKYIFITSSSSLTEETRFLDANDANAEPVVFQSREFNHRYSVEHHESQFIVLTNGGGQYLNYRLCSCPLDNTEKENWKEILPYDPMKHLLDVVPFKNHLVVYECSDALKHFRILKTNSEGLIDGNESYYLEFTEELYFIEPSRGSEQDYDSNSIRFIYDSMLTAKEVWSYDLHSRSKTLLKKTNVLGGFDASEYTMKRIYAPIPEGTQVQAPYNTPIPDTIPISLVYKTNLFKEDGSNPCLLYGYGSYGISIDPEWSYYRFSLLDRGFVYAIAHIRGGGDCGRGWYEAGKFKNKKNTFYDFIACSDEIVKQKITSREVLVIEGRSAGGLLIGATLNMKPDIAAVAVAGVPFVDVINTMMDPTIPLTINEYQEWGCPNEKDYFDYIKTYSPYDNVKEGVIVTVYSESTHPHQFPHLLIKAGLNDPRVAYWEPAKWVAKLRACKADLKNVILLDCKMGSGHFGASGRYAYYKEIAADYAFIIDRIQKIQNN